MSGSLRKGTPTPVHDALVAWTHQAAHWDGGIIDQLVKLPHPDVDESGLKRRLDELNVHINGDDHLADWARGQWDAYRDSFLPKPRSSWEDIDIKWEHPIDNGRGVIVGYVDLFVRCWLERPRYDHYQWRWVSEYLAIHLYFEVKPEIPSVGELLRQINKYRHYVQQPWHRERDEDATNLWIVVSPETRFRGLLKSQDVHLIVPSAQQEQLALE